MVCCEQQSVKSQEKNHVVKQPRLNHAGQYAKAETDVPAANPATQVHHHPHAPAHLLNGGDDNQGRARFQACQPQHAKHVHVALLHLHMPPATKRQLNVCMWQVRLHSTRRERQRLHPGSCWNAVQRQRTGLQSSRGQLLPTLGCSASASVPVSKSTVSDGPATSPCHTGCTTAMLPRRCRRIVGYSSSRPPRPVATVPASAMLCDAVTAGARLPWKTSCPLSACHRTTHAALPSACPWCFVPRGPGRPRAPPAGWQPRSGPGARRRGWAGWGRPAAPPPSCRSCSRGCRTALRLLPAEQQFGRDWSCCKPSRGWSRTQKPAAAARQAPAGVLGRCRFAIKLGVHRACAAAAAGRQGPRVRAVPSGLLALSVAAGRCAPEPCCITVACWEGALAE